MKHRFLEGKIPPDYRLGFESYLYNRLAYRLLQSQDRWLSYFILNDANSTVEAQIHFYLTDSATSIIRAPFGGVEFSEAVNAKVLSDFIQFFCASLKQHLIKNIFIHNPPDAYAPAKTALMATTLLSAGFHIEKSEITNIIRVIPDKAFADIIHDRKRRKLAQTVSKDFEFKKLAARSIAEVYDFIQQHRKKKNYNLSISLEHLRRSLETLPEAYHLFGVFDDGQLVASAVCVQVSSQILYHYISDHVRKVEEARPALVLMQGIYDFCREHGITLLDLGTSMVGDSPNVKLLKFKTEMGGDPTHKFSFIKPLNP